MRLSKEEYKKAEGYLKRYNYNCITIFNIRNDIMSMSTINYDGLPKAQFKISNPVLDSVIQLQENEALKKSLEEYKIVTQAIQLVKEDSLLIFKEHYQKGKSKWDIIINHGLSERTYFRRKKDLIVAVNKEIKKMA